MKQPIPSFSLLIHTIPPGAWQHSCRRPLPAGGHSIDRVVEAFFTASPRWLKALVALRDGMARAIVRRLLAGARDA